MDWIKVKKLKCRGIDRILVPLDDSEVESGSIFDLDQMPYYLSSQ